MIKIGRPSCKPIDRTNLSSMGLASADRSNKTTLLLTAPC